MKETKLQYIIDGVLAVAVIALFVIVFNCKKSCPTPSAACGNDSTSVSIAYVQVDSLLLNYNLYNALQEELMQEEERSRANLNQKASALQAELIDFQNKVENRAFLTEARAKSEQERLLRKQRELQELEAKLTQELMDKQAAMNAQLQQNVDSAINVYNAQKQYQFIFSNTGSTVILYGNPAANITKDILTILNQE